MTSPTDNMVPPCYVVGNQDGEHLLGEEFAVLASLELDPPKEFPHACYPCGRETTWLAQYEFVGGWWSICLGCGEERLVPYTRTVSEHHGI